MARMGRPNTPGTGNLIRRARLRAGLTQRQLADRLGVGLNAVSDSELRANPSLAILEKYGAALGCTLIVMYVTPDGETIR